MRIASRRPKFVVVALALAVSVCMAACTSSEPETKEARENAGGSSNDTAGSSSMTDPSSSEGGAPSGGAGSAGETAEAGAAGTPSAGGPGAGGDGGAGGNAGAGGSDGDPPVCYEAPEGLVYWWNAEPFLMPEPAEEFKMREVVEGEHAQVQGAQYSISAGPVGEAIDFANDMYVEAFPPTTQELAILPWPVGTLEFWFKSSQSSANLVSLGGLGSSETGYGVTLQDGKARLFFRTPDPDAEGPEQPELLTVLSSSTVNDGKFHHVAVTTDSAEAEAHLYVDGTYQGKVAFDDDAGMTFTMEANGASLLMGGDRYQSTYFVGQVDEVSLYSTALGTEQIQGVVGAGTRGKCLP